MKKLLFLILICFLTSNGVFAQSLGKMTLGCKRADIPISLPSGFDICKINTSNHLKYTTNKGDEYVSIYLDDNIVYKIEMHKRVCYDASEDKFLSLLEEIVMQLYESWGEPYYVGENIYWQFQTSKATFSYTVYTSQSDLDPARFYGSAPYLVTFYQCYADIKLEKKTNLFE